MEVRDRIYEVAADIKSNKKEKIEKKTQRLKQMVNKGGSHEFVKCNPMPVPIDHRVEITGIIPDKCFVFMSAMCPLKVSFNVSHESLRKHQHDIGPKAKDGIYSVMYK